ncbi:hypothetical protein [Sinorhizobium meliloti]|uniref:hypothetical protein n=1 Tax=Rhizobium meliloti TaxID=382 RepID=UPI000FDAD97B|nr:hypothetical protein [Sinorhizobium meliloti]RVG30716.1 hypothetical protein CN229_11755 [Sinorhizobium meliloti]
MADGSIKIDIETDPNVHAVEAIRDLADVVPPIVRNGVKVEIEFSSMQSVGMTSTRRAITVTFARDDE